MTVPAATVNQYYTGIFRQAPSAAVSAAYQAMPTANDALNSMLNSANLQVDPVVRLYQTAFNRVPDSAGMTSWVSAYTAGAITLQQIANGFTQSTEFTTLYPTSMSNTQYVGALYWNILQRSGEDAGMQGWVNALNSGALTRAQVLLGFSESAEFKANTENRVNAFLTGCANNTTTYTGSLFDQGGGSGSQYTLTVNIDTVIGTGGNDYISGALSSNGALTLQTLDSIDGGGGTDTLYTAFNSTAAAQAVTPTRITNVEVFEVTNTGTANTATLNLSQVTGVQTVNVAGSSAQTAVTNIGNATAALKSTGTAAQVDFTIQNATLAGSADTVNLAVDGHTGVVTIQSTGTNNIEGVAITANGTASTIGTLTVGNNAGATISSMSVSGSAAVTIGTRAVNAGAEAITVGVTSYDGSASSGGATVYFGAANVTATGGSGNDTLNFSTTAGNVSVNGGAGNDNFVFGEPNDPAGAVGPSGTLTTADTIVGGDGTDTIQALSANLVAYVKPATPTISGVETLRVMDALGGALTTSNVQVGITTVQLDAATGGNTVTFDTGVAATLRLNAAAGAAINAASAGAATTDAVTIKNATAGTDVFDGRAVTATGVETLSLDGGTTTTRVAQTATTVTATSGVTALSFVGNNTFTLTGAVTAGTVDASGLTGAALLTMVTGTTGVTSITGSANADTLFGRAALATSVYGGAGNDTITGGTAADLLHGEDGNDAITAGGGNDTVRGGAGNDVVTTTGALTNLMTFDGGDGTDTLVVDTATTAGLSNTTNFETLRLNGANLTQNMAVFAGTTFTRVDVANAGGGTTTISNAAASAATLRAVTGVGTVDFQRLVDLDNDTLTFGAYSDAATTIATLTLNQEDTLNIGAGAIVNPANGLTVTGLNAITVDAINISGAQSTSVTVNAAAATTGFGVSTATARTIVVDASAATGTVVFNAANAASNQALTMTGSSTASSTLTGGAGADSITGGNAASSLVGGGGNDTITGGVSNDTLSGGLGADQINGGSGTDTYETGVTTGGTDNGTGTIVGMVVNLGSSTLSAAAVSTATGGLATAGGNTAIATNVSGYLASAASLGAGLSGNLDTLVSIENVVGTSGTDYIVGSSAANSLAGLAGNDTISGGGGDDTITGGTGADSMTGGTGTDVFVLAAGDEPATTVTYTSTNATSYSTNASLVFNSAIDVITDFLSGTDKLDVGIAGSVSNLFNTAASASTSGTNWFVQGSWDAANSNFIIASGGADTLVLHDAANNTATNAANAGNYIVLVGTAGVVAADFI